MVRWILWCFDRVAFIVRLAGADYDQFHAILQAKLTLDNRRQSSGFRTNSASPRSAFAMSLFMYAFMGIFVGVLTGMASSPLTGLTMVHSMVLVLVGMSLIADFTGVLIDTTDLAILDPRPVSGRTLLVARLAHICTYLGMLGLSLSAATMIIGAFKYGGLFPFVYMVTLVCNITLTVFLVNLFYLTALRFANVERFKDIIVYFQIAMAIMLIFGYQLLPRVVDFKALGKSDWVGAWWTYLTPPCWFAAPVELLAGSATPPVWALAAEGVLIPLLGLLLVVRFLAPGFSRSLSQLGSDVSGKDVRLGRRCTKPLRDRLGAFLAGLPEQRVGFDLVWTMSSRDRQFKLRIYPMLAFILIWPIIMLLISEKSPSQIIADLQTGKKHLFLLYVAMFMFPMALLQIQYSTQFEAAWIYRALPLRRPGGLMVGAMKALGCRFVFPLYLVFAGGLLALIGPKVLPDVAFALCMTGVVTVTLALLMNPGLPFSANLSALQSSGQFGKNMLSMILPVIAGGGHWLLTLLPYGSFIVVVATLPAAWLCLLLTRIYAGRGWSRFEERVVAAP